VVHKLLHQERFPWFSTLSIVTTLTVSAVVIAACSSNHNGFEGLGIALLAFFAMALGLVLNMIWGLVAHLRHEYCGGRIAAAGIVLPVAILLGWGYVSNRLEIVAEHSRMWTIEDIFVQPDGKLVLVGSGLVRLLPDGQRDPSFHRDYSFARRSSLPNPIRQGYGWPEGACAAMAPSGDLLLAAKGWIGRVRPDGSDAPDLLNRAGKEACWGLAVQSDGKILVGWDSPSKSPISRLFPDGSVDPSFHPAFASTPGTDQGQWTSHNRIAILRDGRILLAGLTEPLGGGCIRSLRRLKANGSPDESFRFKELDTHRLDDWFRSNGSCQPDVGWQQYVLHLIAILPDGSMLVHSHNGHWAFNETVYLDRDGNQVRTELRGTRVCDDLVRARPSSVVPMSDGGILLDADEWIMKVRPDGTLDRAFHASHTYLSAQKIVLQGEKILILDGHGKLARLNSDGSPDPSFQTPALRVYSD
jgi:uncharacterized delta-60 repeat protein